jgi:hypothetical protein
VEVVVVVGERDDDARRTLEPRVRAHEDHLGAGVDEPADEVLGQRQVDLLHRPWRQLLAIETGVVQVDVEAVLVRRVAGQPVSGAEVAAAGPAQVADPDSGGLGMSARELAHHAQRRAH